jgi:hypothetical protein
LGFLLETAYLLPLTALSLLVAVIALGYGARRRRGYLPLAVGGAAAALLILGKFVLDSNMAVFVGLYALAGMSLWNAWPVKPIPGCPLPPTETLDQIGSIVKEK